VERNCAMSDRNERFQRLVRELKAGSPDAARELTETYGGHVLRVIRRRLPQRLRSQFDSLDFAQIVWKSVLCHPARLADLDDAERFAQWLAALASNKVISIGRRFQTARQDISREQHLPEAATLAVSERVTRQPTPSAVAIFREEWERVLHEQPERARRVMELRFTGSTFEEIAHELGIEESTARKIIARLRERSRRRAAVEQRRAAS